MLKIFTTFIFRIVNNMFTFLDNYSLSSFFPPYAVITKFLFQQYGIRWEKPKSAYEKTPRSHCCERDVLNSYKTSAVLLIEVCVRKDT